MRRKIFTVLEWREAPLFGSQIKQRVDHLVRFSVEMGLLRNGRYGNYFHASGLACGHTRSAKCAKYINNALASLDCPRNRKLRDKARSLTENLQ